MKSHALFEPRSFPRSKAPGNPGAGARLSSPQETAQFVDAYLPALLAQAHDLVASEFHAVAAQHGLAPSEWRVLATLASGKPMSIGRLAEIVVMKQPTVTRLLDRMEGTGHVRRVPHGEDRRVTLIAITPAGKTVAARLVELAREHESRVLQPLGVRDSKELKETLAKLIALHRRSDDGEAAADTVRPATRRAG